MNREYENKGNVSVLMSVYMKEKPEYLRQALDSIFHQTLLPREIVFMEDGPLTEELNRTIEECEQEAIRNGIEFQRYHFENSVQLGRALQKGVTLCKYDLIARMDTDDIAVKTRLERQVAYMQEHKEVSALGGAIMEFADDSSYRKIKPMPMGYTNILSYARYRNPVNHMTVMLRKEAVLRCGNYQHFPFLEDYELWCRMISNGELFDNLDEVLVEARTNCNMYGRRGGFAYFKQYMLLRKEQKDKKLLAGFAYVKAVILTFGMTMQPSWLRKLVYQKVLRKNNPK